MTILETLFVLLLAFIFLWFVVNIFDFTTISLNAKTARCLGDLSIRLNDWDEQRQAYGVLNSIIHAKAMVKAGQARLLFYLQNSHNFQIAHKCVLSAFRTGWVLLPPRT